jgi:hypothetical protein
MDVERDPTPGRCAQISLRAGCCSTEAKGARPNQRGAQTAATSRRRPRQLLRYQGATRTNEEHRMACQRRGYAGPDRSVAGDSIEATGKRTPQNGTGWFELLILPSDTEGSVILEATFSILGGPSMQFAMPEREYGSLTRLRPGLDRQKL